MLQEQMDEQLQIRNFLLKLYRDSADTRVKTGKGRNKTVVVVIEVDLEDEANWQENILDWAESDSERFQWALNHSKQLPEILSTIDMTTYTKKYELQVYLSDQSLTEWLLRYS
jgi:hypothetical protein